MSTLRVDTIETVSGDALLSVNDIITKTELATGGGNLLVGSFNTVAEALAGITVDDAGKRVSWLGYYVAGDGGSGWGIVQTGTHTDDGGAILTAGASLYIEQNLKGDIINVKKYGAVGDDTANDLSKINAASAYAKTLGADLFFPPGFTYFCDCGAGASTSIVNLGTGNHVTERNLLARSNQTWFLSGAKIRLVRRSNSFVCPEAVSETYYADNFHVVGGTIDGSYDGSGPDTTNSYGFWGSYRNSTFNGIIFENHDSDGLTFYDGHNKVSNCVFRNIGRHGIAVIDGADTTIIGNTFESTIIHAGVRIEPNVESQVTSGVRILDNTFFGGAGVSCNHIGTPAGRANNAGSIIRGNIFNLSYIYFEDSSDLLIDGNILKTHAEAAAIMLPNTRSIITNNTIVGSTTIPTIALTNSFCAGSIIKDNVISFMDSSGTSAGIEVAVAGELVTVKGNTITNAGGNAITIVNCDKVTVDGNTVNGANKNNASGNNAGILVDNSGITPTACRITNNTVIDTNAVSTLYRGIHARGTYTNSYRDGNIVDNSNSSPFTGFIGFDTGVKSDAGTGGSASAGTGNQYVEIEINGTVYKMLHDGTV